MKLPINKIRPKGQARETGINKTEARYEREILTRRRDAGEILWWKFEPMSLRLGPNCFYRPDFLVMLADGSLELHEVKGFMQDDARVKLSVCADMYPFPIQLCRLIKGAWQVEEVR